MFFHLVQSDSELPNDNPALADPCGILALLQAYVAEAEAVTPPAYLADAGQTIRREPPAAASVRWADATNETTDEDEIEEQPRPVAPRESGILPISAAVFTPLSLAAEASEPATVRERSARDDLDDLDDLQGEEIEVVEELPPVEFEITQPTTPDASAGEDPFATFVSTLVAVAQNAGCSRAAALLPALLDGGQVDPNAFGEAALEGLVGAGVLDRDGVSVVGGEGFRRTATAWRAILRGDSDDFAACGPRMLDEWAADLVARILAAPAKTEVLRRELRTRGVAAFGLVMAA